jgi:hypothetical protein
VLKDVETRKQIRVIKESLARLALSIGSRRRGWRRARRGLRTKQCAAEEKPKPVVRLEIGGCHALEAARQFDRLADIATLCARANIRFDQNQYE